MRTILALILVLNFAPAAFADGDSSDSGAEIVNAAAPFDASSTATIAVNHQADMNTVNLVMGSGSDVSTTELSSTGGAVVPSAAAPQNSGAAQ